MITERESSDAPTRPVRPPSPARIGMRLVEARIRERLFGAPTTATSIGRFTVVGSAGAGGMGVVFEAHDPELDRRVAIKLVSLRFADCEAAQARLLAEAQTLARLDHPNIVTVYEVGRHLGGLYLAMEYIEGETLERWLARSGDDWRSIVRVFAEAGQGVLAAHRAGVVHGDFKPSNVMLSGAVREVSRVRVLDFGLAIDSGCSDESDPTPSSPAETARELRNSAFGGTPRYMAPELRSARPRPDARSDQYAFCISMWSALYREHPFARTDADEMTAAMVRGVTNAPGSTRVPSWLRRVLERGLAPTPSERWPTMAELVEALARGEARARRRRVLVIAVAVAVLGAGLAGTRALAVARRTAACEQQAAIIEQVWNQEKYGELREVLSTNAPAFGGTTADKIAPWLDRQAAAWREARVEACMDAEVHGRWDADMLERSLWCLDERKTELASLVDEVVAGVPEAVQGSVMAAAGLTSVTRCRDEAVLQLATPPPVEQREAIRLVRDDLARVGNLARAARNAEGLALARRTRARAVALDWPPLSAAAGWRLGQMLERNARYDEAETVLEDAYFAAVEAGAGEVAAAAAIQLVFVSGLWKARYREGLRWGRHANAAASALPDGAQIDRAELASGLAALHFAIGGEEEQAAELHARALEIREALLGPAHPLVAHSLSALAEVHYASGDYERSRQLHARALAILQHALGDEHPNVAKSLSSLGTAHFAEGEHHDAEVLYERAIALIEKALGREHPSLGDLLDNLAHVRLAMGRNTEARAAAERALGIQEHALGPDHPRVATSLAQLASIHADAGRHEDARRLFERALAIQQRVLGPEHPDVAETLSALALSADASGQRDQARTLLERVLTMMTSAVGPDHTNVARTLHNLAEIHIDDGRYEEARAMLERAIAIDEKAFGPAHPGVAMHIAMLGHLHFQSGSPAHADSQYARALTILERALGSDHIDVVRVLVLHACDYAEDLPADDEGVTLAERAVARAERARAPTSLLARARSCLVRVQSHRDRE
jgi:eukaryotic-like serine/threonine-protein kinase